MVVPWALVAAVLAATVLGGAWADADFNGTAYVTTPAGLLAAGNNVSVSEIVLLGGWGAGGGTGMAQGQGCAWPCRGPARPDLIMPAFPWLRRRQHYA